MRSVCLLVLVSSLALAAPAAATDFPVGFGGTFGLNYSPPTINIATSDTVSFSGSFSSHPLVWDAGEFPTTSSGSGPATFQFSAPGTYSFHCQIHQALGMVGKVVVAGDQHPTRVSFSISPAAPTVGQAVTFTYTGDPDPDGTLVRWEWDLDGDGSFETSSTTPSASHAYAVAGTVNVSVRAVDNGNEASATATQAITIAPAAGTSNGSGNSSSGATDRTAPRATRVKLQGLTLRFVTSEAATATATLRAGGRTLARGSARRGHTTVRMKLTAAGRARLRHHRKVSATLALTLRDAAGNASTIRRKVTLRR
jgi:plastocyanin